jgi:hypothetical protein
MNKSYYISAFFLLLFFITSCDKNSFNTDTEILLPSVPPKLVIWSVLTSTDAAINVKVSTSASANNANIALSVIANATVLLWKDGEIYRKLTYQPKTGIYTAPLVPIGESKSIFKLTVAAEGYQSVSATQKMPASVILDVHSASFLGFTPRNEAQYDFTANFADAENEKNYYRIHFTEVIKRKNATKNTEIDCKMIDNDVVSAKSIYANFLQDELFNGRSCDLQYSIASNLGAGDNLQTLKIHFAAINKDTYLYGKSRHNYDLAVGNPFAEPVLIHTNIQNGYGIFALENKQVTEVKP